MVYILAISGPTAAGKTYFSNKLVEVVEKHGYTISKISTDEFYHDLSHMTMEMRSQVNYDLPQSIDAEGFETCLEQLSLGKVTDVPVYDFSTHTRTGEIRTVTPPDLLIVEGIFSLSFEGSNRLYDLKVFIELDRDLRLIRRMERDMKERGRS
ncbi:MAG: uridine kinase family protein, partial [Candidatus Kariarchaeaceae archaeon]